MELKLRYLIPTAFGKFHAQEPLTFEDGLNLLQGQNEAGKSTLEAFIHGMFYGFKKEGKSRISRLPEFERYRPWTGGEYRGVLGYEEGGRNYRIERSFDPDIVKILDDDTGEDLTREFNQDSRKEYDFAERHLGLSAKEFRNTVWIGQLESRQEPGLGTEIQGKLGDILQGGTEDVSLATALSALVEERSKIKSPRSTKQPLDVVVGRLAELEKEAEEARVRESQVRDWLLEVSSLSHTRDELISECASRQADLDRTRHAIVADLVARVTALDEKAEELRESLSAREWAKDVPKDATEAYKLSLQEKQSLEVRCCEVEAELDVLRDKARTHDGTLQRLSKVRDANTDEAAIASMYARYLSAKAAATRGQRVANDARRVLRAAEEETRSCGLLDRELGEETIRQAEELQSTVYIAEKQKDTLEVEAERARSQVASRSPGGASASGPLYGLSLGVLGIAIVLTVMGGPWSIPAFVIAVAAFALGIYRQNKAATARREDEAVLTEKERLVTEQETCVEEARQALSDYLEGLGVSSPEQLRAFAREAAAVRARYKSAKDKFDVAQDYWFEASQDYAAIEKDLVSVLRVSGTLGPNEFVSDGAVESLKADLRSLTSASQAKSVASERVQETQKLLEELRTRLAGLEEKERALLASAGVVSSSELFDKAKAKEEYDDMKRSMNEILRRKEALLEGRSLKELASELEELEASLGETTPLLRRAHERRDSGEYLGETLSDASSSNSLPPCEGGAPSSSPPIPNQKVYDENRLRLDEVKERLAAVNSDLASLQSGIRIRTEEGRALAAVEEEIARYRALESEMSLERDALDLAHDTLDNLSKGIRREFAPILNQRVGELLASITSERYQSLKVSAELRMSVVHPDTGEVVGIDTLSSGTLDQCYFALRVAIAELIIKKSGFALFLDDSFVQYDDKRLEGALAVLSTLSRRHQIVLFSCHHREEAAARKMGIQHHLVRL